MSNDSLEKLLPRCKAKDTDDFTELKHVDASERCWNCRVWEAIDAHSLQERIDELKQLSELPIPASSVVINKINRRIKELEDGKAR